MGTSSVLLALFCTLLLYFATTDGIPTFIDGTSLPKDVVDIIDVISGVRFILYTKKDFDGYVLKFLDNKNFENSTWNSSKHAKFITHGWLDNAYGKPCVTIRNAFSAIDNFNVVVIDWEPIATNSYSRAKARVPNVAKYVAKFIDFIKGLGGLDYDETLLIGHGLGAHLISLSAKYTNGTFGQVLGLDPVRRDYSHADENTRIDKSHANHVQVIHTNSGRLGLDDNFGTSDFIVNGGKSQPGCGYLDVFGNCAHAKSYEYYAESIRNSHGFKGTRCTTNKDPISCFAYMGGPTLDTSAQGIYEVNTTSTFSYALG